MLSAAERWHLFAALAVSVELAAYCWQSDEQSARVHMCVGVGAGAT
jgi:hypothetical protein